MLDLDCAAFPNTTAVRQPDWDYFAWNSFIAANWPAIDPFTYNEQRGIPDVRQSFTGAASDSLLTWETYKEKREVFFYPAGTTPPINPGQWNQPPFYGPLNPPIPMCPGNAAQAGKQRRVFMQGGKMPFNSLDETVEVASEALESQAQLCGGVPNPMCGTASQADCCLVPSLPVGPRVWKGQPSEGQPVVYEVKVNYDFFQYVTASPKLLYLDSNAQASATTGAINLPWRTSAATGPGGPNSGKTGYIASRAVATYSPLYVTPTSNVTPYPSGAIHLKAAWMMLQDEDPSRFHTTQAGYFREDSAGNKCMAIGTFGLIGLHIIQRIHQNTGQTANALGGTFIFATWEHVDNDTAGFRYSNFFVGQPLEHSRPKKGFYPALTATLPVTRRYPILPGTANSNAAVHQAIAKVNPRSVWLNYQLIGVQFQAVNSLPETSQIANQNDPTGIGQPVFLANSVIETNVGLQHFRGLPGLVAPIAKYQPYIAPTRSLAFNRNTQNVTFGQQGYNMGGCMGCHGVAQTKGFSFSFVLLGGQRGADVDTQTQFTVPPPPAIPPSQ